MRLELHNFPHPDKETTERFCRLERMLGIINGNLESIMIDTTRLLDAAEKATTDNASLRALAKSTFEALMQAKTDLAVAIAASDPAATAAAQRDIDAVVEKLNLDDQATKDALAANVQPAPAQAPDAPAPSAPAADPSA